MTTVCKDLKEKLVLEDPRDQKVRKEIQASREFLESGGKMDYRVSKANQAQKARKEVLVHLDRLALLDHREKREKLDYPVAP